MTITASGASGKFTVQLTPGERAAVRVLAARMRTPAATPTDRDAFTDLVQAGWTARMRWADEQTKLARERAWDSADAETRARARAAARDAQDAVLGFDPEA